MFVREKVEILKGACVYMKFFEFMFRRGLKLFIFNLYLLLPVFRSPRRSCLSGLFYKLGEMIGVCPPWSAVCAV